MPRKKKEKVSPLKRVVCICGREVRLRRNGRFPWHRPLRNLEGGALTRSLVGGMNAYKWCEQSMASTGR